LNGLNKSQAQSLSRSATVIWRTVLKAGRSRVRFSMVSLEFLIPVALCPWSWLSL